MEKFLVIDGNSIINRAFYAVRMLSNKSGMFTNGIYGFLNVLFKNIEELNPDYVAVAFDLRAPTFRHKKYAKYKATRKGMPSELAMQLPVLKEILCAMNIAVYEKEGYEADDIIGTVSRFCDEKNVKCYIVTGDKDDLQLAGENTNILLTVTKGGATQTTVYDHKAVLKEYAITPLQFIDLKGLMGDPSDNVPGVKGVGEKTAFELIKEYGSIEQIYENIDKVKKTVKEKLVLDKEMAFLSKELCTIDRFVPMDFSFEDAKKREFNNEKLAEIFKNLEFTSFLKKFQLTSDEEEMKIPDLELTDQIPKINKLFYKLYINENEVFAISFLDNELPKAILKPGTEMLKEVFENEKILKISENIKEDIVVLNGLGIDFKGEYFDISVGGYVINPSRNGYEISELSAEFLGYGFEGINQVLGKGKSKKKLSDLEDALYKTMAQEVFVTKKLYEYEVKSIEESGQHKLLYDIEFPLILVLASMEIDGFLVDKEKLTEFGKMLAERIAHLEKEIYNIAGEEFNISSPKQLGVILFEKLKLPVIKKTKTGYSTGAEVLDKLLGYNEIIEKIMEYRQLTKLKSTYADGLLSVVSPVDGKIHSKFNQTVTVTGRISSTEPNLQNIPMKQDLGREIRKMFVPSSDEMVLIDADYSQIELRILAHISGDESMIQGFNNDGDIHTATAKKIFGVEEDEITPLLRSRAKAVNFGIVYGMGDFSLAQDLSITKKEAKEYIDGYFKKYPKVKKYMEDIVETGRSLGYVETLFGRRRYLPELKSSNFIVRSSGERMAMNTPIQGTAADIIKIAMINVYRELKKQNLKSRLILQVHDELIIETYKDETEKVVELLISCMEKACKLDVPLVVDAKVGDNWYDAH